MLFVLLEPCRLQIEHLRVIGFPIRRLLRLILPPRARTIWRFIIIDLSFLELQRRNDNSLSSPKEWRIFIQIIPWFHQLLSIDLRLWWNTKSIGLLWLLHIISSKVFKLHSLLTIIALPALVPKELDDFHFVFSSQWIVLRCSHRFFVVLLFLFFLLYLLLLLFQRQLAASCSRTLHLLILHVFYHRAKPVFSVQV